MTQTAQPALFVSHGAPTFAIEPGLLGPKLRRYGERLSNLAAVVVVSAHWQTPGVQVMRTAKPETIHDFGGFPPALYRIKYPAPGDPALATETQARLEAAGFEASSTRAKVSTMAFGYRCCTCCPRLERRSFKYRCRLISTRPTRFA